MLYANNSLQGFTSYHTRRRATDRCHRVCIAQLHYLVFTADVDQQPPSLKPTESGLILCYKDKPYMNHAKTKYYLKFA